MKVIRKISCVLGVVALFCAFLTTSPNAETVEVNKLLADDLANWTVTYGSGKSAVVQDNNTLLHDGKFVFDSGLSDLHAIYNGTKGPKDGDMLQFKIKVIDPGMWIIFFFRSSAQSLYKLPVAPNIWDAGTSKYGIFFWGADTAGAGQMSPFGWSDAHPNQGLTYPKNSPLTDGNEHLIQITTKNVETGVQITIKIDGEDPLGLTGGTFVDTVCKFEETGYFGFQSYSEGKSNVKFEISDVEILESSSSSSSISSSISSTESTSNSESDASQNDSDVSHSESDTSQIDSTAPQTDDTFALYLFTIIIVSIVTIQIVFKRQLSV